MPLEPIALVVGMSFVDYAIQLRAWQRSAIVSENYNGTHRDEMTVLIPAFGSPRYLERVRDLGVKTAIVTTDHESIEFEQALSKLSVEVFRAPVRKPHSYNLLKYGVAQIKTPYVLCLDADTEVGDDITKIPSMLIENGLDLASFLILPKNPKRLVEKLQHFEYILSMNARKVYPWLTSGAALAGKTT